MKKWGFVVLLSICLGASAMADAEKTDVLELNAKAAVLIDAASGRVLYGYNEDKMLPMASTTKVMTALLAIEQTDMDEIVTASKRASGVPGTSIYLSVGEQLTMKQMLQGLMLRSGNDAAVAIAEHVAGSVEAFAEKMNERAVELGAQAHFVTPNGLDEGGHSISALGLALVAREAMTHEEFREIVGTRQATIPWAGSEYDRVLTNKNRLLKEYEGATGIKTGFTKRAGRCLVFSAERDGMELIGVVLNCGTWFESAKTLLNWGFERYSMEEAARTGEAVTTTAVHGGWQKSVALAAGEDLCGAICSEDTWSIETEVSELEAPVEKGQRAGVMRLVIDGEVVDECPLITVESVEKRSFRSALKRLFSYWPGLYKQ